MKISNIRILIIVCLGLIWCGPSVVAEETDSIPSLSSKLKGDLEGAMVEPMPKSSLAPSTNRNFNDLKTGDDARVTVPKEFNKPGVFKK